MSCCHLMSLAGTCRTCGMDWRDVSIEQLTAELAKFHCQWTNEQILPGFAMESEFHATDGLSFARVPSDQGHGVGAVRVIVRATASDGAPVLREFVLRASAWSSVVASMSSLGETGTTWAMAMVLQQGGFVDDSLLRTNEESPP